jgi:TonB family protein
MSEPTTRAERDVEAVRATPSPNDHTTIATASQATAMENLATGATDEQLATHLSDLVRLNLERGNFAEAEPLLIRLLELKSAAGEERSDVATVLASLATVRYALGRHESAEQLWRRVLAIRERSLAPNHFAIARSIEHLADICVARGKLEEAVMLLQRAIAMQEQTSGPTDERLSAMRAKAADLRLLASQEAIGGGGIGTEPRAPSRTLSSGAPSNFRDESAGAPPPTTPPGGLLVLTPAGLYADSERDTGDLPGDGKSDAPWVNDGPRTLRRWWSMASGIVSRGRGHWRQLAIAVAALSVVPLGIFASARGGGGTPRPGPAAHTATGAADRAGRPHAAEPLTVSSTEHGEVLDTAVMSAAPAVVDAKRQVASQASPPPATPSSDAPRSQQTRSADVASIRLPDALGAVNRNMNRSMDSTLRTITGSALMPGAGEPGLGASRSSGGSPAPLAPTDLKPPVLAVGSPMPEYPAALRSEGVSGTVLAEFIVDPNGHADVTTLEVLHSDNRMFTAAVRRALPTMQFVPAESSGHRVSQRLQMPFSFVAGSR